MSKTSQIKKNIKLSSDLTNYLMDNPLTLAGLPSNASVVAFSKDDHTLNKVNTTMIESLINEGTIVVKAEETNKEKLPWKFTPIFP